MSTARERSEHAPDVPILPPEGEMAVWVEPEKGPGGKPSLAVGVRWSLNWESLSAWVRRRKRKRRGD